MNPTNNRPLFTILALSAGILTGLSQPGNGMGWVSLVSVSPLFYILLHDLPWRRVIRCGLLFAFSFTLVALYWIHLSDISGFIGSMIVIQIRYILTFTVFYWLKRAGVNPLVILPLFILHEFAYTKTELDFPWFMIGYTLSDYPLLCQIAEWTGIYGISLFVYGVNYSVAYQLKNIHRLQVKPIIAGLLIYVLLNLLSYGLASSRMEFEAIKAGIVQPNIDPFLKWRPSYRKTSLDRLEKGTAETLADSVDFIVWPETSVPYNLYCEYRLQWRMQAIADTFNTTLVIGSLASYQPDGEARRTTNAAFHFYPNRSYELYEKQRLVPVVEKSIQLLNVFNNLPGQSGYAFGNRIHPFQTQTARYSAVYDPFTATWSHSPSRIRRDTLTFATSICIESNYPELYQAFQDSTPIHLANVITNDGWFFPHIDAYTSVLAMFGISQYQPSKGAFQHNQIAKIRAIENRITIIRSANTGVSSIIDPFGFNQAILDQYREGTITGYAPVPVTPGRTLFARSGYLVQYILLSWIGLLIVRRFIG